MGAVLLVAVWSAVNWMYQVVRKPTELFFPVSGALSKAPAETWRQYGPLFHEHSTATITPDLLAALDPEVLNSLSSESEPFSAAATI